MIVYAETSALLRWLLGGSRAGEVAACLAAAERVVTSRLALAEIRRVLTRAVAAGAVPPAAAARVRAEADLQAAGWDVMEIGIQVWSRAEERFPIEPVRMLDAVHLATALRFQELAGGVTMLSTDARILGNARSLGIADALESSLPSQP